MSQKLAQIFYKSGITTGTTVTSAAGSANVAIPNDAGGSTARHVMLVSTGTVHVKFGIDATVTATANDFMVGTAPVFLDTRGAAYIAYIQEAASSKLNIAPVEV